MQDLNCSLFELQSYNVGMPYGFAELIREKAHMYFCLYQALLSLILFTLSIANNVNIKMNKQ